MIHFRKIWLGTTLLTLGTLTYWSCGTGQKPNGEVLARQYCAGCHVFPEPALLDKKTWAEGALPYMAIRLGVQLAKTDSSLFQNYEEQLRVEELGVFPKVPVVLSLIHI